MKRALALAAVSLSAAAFAAAGAPERRDLMHIYNGLVKVSGGRTFSMTTNGTAVARFVGNLFGNFQIWNPEMPERFAEITSPKISILSTMVGDRVDFSVSGKIPAGSLLGKELAAVKPVDHGLFKFIPANASVVYVSGIHGDSPLDRHALPLRAMFVEQLRAMMPPRATYRDFALFVAPARKGGGAAAVCVFRLASAVPPLDSLAGKKLASVFTLAKPPPGEDPPPDGFSRYHVTSSFRDALGGGSRDVDEMLQFAAAANAVMGPMTMETTCKDGYVFFEVGPAGDLAERLSRGEGATFNVNALLPLLRPGLSMEGIRTAIYASPSAATRQTMVGLGRILKPVIADLAPDGDGGSGVIVTTPDGDFTWGWSITRSEIEAHDQNERAVQRAFKTILIHGVQLRGM